MRLLPFLCFLTVVGIACAVVIGFVVALTPISDFDRIRDTCLRRGGNPVDVLDRYGDVLAIRCDREVAYE